MSQSSAKAAPEEKTELRETPNNEEPDGASALLRTDRAEPPSLAGYARIIRSGTNKDLKYPDNYVHTTHFTVLNFLPVSVTAAPRAAGMVREEVHAWAGRSERMSCRPRAVARSPSRAPPACAFVARARPTPPYGRFSGRGALPRSLPRCAVHARRADAAYVPRFIRSRGNAHSP